MISKDAKDDKLHFLKLGVWINQFITTLLVSFAQGQTLQIPYILAFSPLIFSIILMAIILQYNTSTFFKNLSIIPRIALKLFIINISIFLILFIILGSLKLDGVIDSNWAFVFIPLWYCMFVYAAFCIYLIPGLIHPSVQKYRISFVMVLYLFGAFFFTVFQVCYLDEGKFGPGVVVAPIITTGISHFASYIGSRIYGKIVKRPLRFRTDQFIWVITIFVFSNELIWLYIVQVDFIPHFFIYVPAYKFLGYLMIFENLRYYRKKKDQPGSIN